MNFHRPNLYVCSADAVLNCRTQKVPPADLHGRNSEISLRKYIFFFNNCSLRFRCLFLCCLRIAVTQRVTAGAGYHARTEEFGLNLSAVDEDLRSLSEVLACHIKSRAVVGHTADRYRVDAELHISLRIPDSVCSVAFSIEHVVLEIVHILVVILIVSAVLLELVDYSAVETD